MDEKLKTLSKIFSSLPSVLVRETLSQDDVNGDIEIASQRLQKFQAMENLPNTFQTSVGGKGPTVTGQEKNYRAADFREKEKKGKFANHDRMSKNQGGVKALRNLTTDSSCDYSLGQNDSYQSNRGQNRKPSGVFGEGPRGLPLEGLGGGFVQGQSSNQGFKAMGVSKEGGVGQGHFPRPNTKCKSRGRGRGRGRGNLPRFTESGDRQAGASKEQSRFQQNQLLVSGLSALTTEDCLVNFIEAMSGGEVETVMLRNDKALITMANDITGKLNIEV